MQRDVTFKTLLRKNIKQEEDIKNYQNEKI